MKRFFSNLVSSILGVFIAFLIIFGIGALIIGGLVSGIGEKDAVDVKNNSVLKISINQPIPDRGWEDPELIFSGSDFKLKERMGLNHILTVIEHAKDDDRIKGIYLDLGLISPGAATLEEIRNKLLEFKQAGKFIVAYGEMISEYNYYLASVANHVVLHPAGLMEFNGMAYQQVFFKKALEKLGVKVQVFYVGKYKSATEPFRYADMTEANRKQINVMLTSMENHYKSTVGGARTVSPERIDSLQNSLSIFNPKSAVIHNLADSLMYNDQVMDLLKENAGLDPDSTDQKLQIITTMKYYEGLKQEGKLIDFEPDTMIAIVYAEGEIINGTGMDGAIGSKTYVETIRELRKDDVVGAIVLRVNSPGGSALASDAIWREIVLTKEVKPVVVSMGNLAASGGYYISAPANKIFAQSNTITGSIGIFGMWLNVGKLMEEKLGITSDTVKTAEYADFGNIFRSLSEREETVVQNYVESGYSTFLNVVAQGRDMDTSQVHEIAQGRIWSGTDALDIGLVDYIGGLGEAIDKAAELGGIENYYTEAYPERKDFFERLSKMFSTEAEMETWLNSREMKPFKLMYENAKRMTESNEHLYYRMPYEIIVE